MILRLLLSPLVLLLRLLAWPFWTMARKRASPPGALLEVRLRGTVHEGPERPRARWSLRSLLERRSRRTSGVRLPTLRLLIDEVLADPRAGGLLLTIGALSSGWANLEALRAELLRVVRGGKRLVAWLPEGAGNREMYVATAAPMIVAPPTVDIALTGVKSARHFLRGALDRAGIDVELHARTEFKSAADSLVRTDRSPADRLQTEAILDAIDRALVAALAEGRRVDEVRARAMIDEGPTRASVAKERSVIDALAHDDDLGALLACKIVAAGAYLGRRRAGRRDAPMFARRKAIAIVEVHGAITSVATPLARAMGELALAEQVIADLRAAERDPRIAGVILDIDSPGGTVTASDAIYAAAKRLASKKPVVARMGDVAASGGYYVAAAARAIVARPLTVTGSIGVVAARPIADRLAAKLGIARDVIARGRFADLDAVTRVPREDERALLEREIDGHYRAFVSIVAASRGRAFDEVEALARGRVWIGSDAHAQRLVDHLGGLELATSLVRAALPGVALEDRPRVLAARVPSRRLADPPAATPAAPPVAAMLDALSSMLPVELREALAPMLAVLGEGRVRALALAAFEPPA